MNNVNSVKVSPSKFGSSVATGAINPFLVGAEQLTQTKYKPRIFGNFESSEDFLYVLEVLETAEEGDVVELSISSLGGCASALSTLLHAMDKCQAHIHCIYTGYSASAGTFPLFHCDSFELAGDSQFLFHECVTGVYPQTVSASVAELEFTKKWNERMIRSHYEGFFNEQELQMVLNGKQWMAFPEEVEERFAKRQEYLERKQKDMEKQERKAAAQMKRAMKNAMTEN